MPTPSSPDPQPPYTISTTCPDPDEQQRAPLSASNWHGHEPLQYDFNVDVSRRTVTDPRLQGAQDNTSTPAIRSPEPHFGHSHELFPDEEVSSAPNAESQERIELHETLEIYDELTDSPHDFTSPESILTRYGVRQDVMHSHDFGTDIKTKSEHGAEEDYTIPSMGYGFPSTRTIPSSPSSFLRAGSLFIGTQQSERQRYTVQVEIKYVDLRESFLCGYLRIQGLTHDHPSLTTYFEGEIIGNKYGFMTKHESWGANDKTDLSHWSKFPAFRPYSKQARKGSSMVMMDISQNEHIFMRWKEHFLVPDHRVLTITGASFAGFYYVCFNQVLGEVNGIYFHSKSERFQQLELKHVEDRGCCSAMEFR